MRALLAMVIASSLAVTAGALQPLVLPPVPTKFEAIGLQEVRHPDFERLDAILKKRAPGWGILLRTHVAQAIGEESEAAGLDPMLVLAVIAVESEFQQDAVSVVGAKGLMQVRPSTLFFVAQKEGVRLSKEELAADPSLNVRLGVRYLKAMRDRFSGNLDLALMAYNAGPNRLAEALKEGSTDAYQGYVNAVRRQFGRLKQAMGESGDWALAARGPLAVP